MAKHFKDIYRKVSRKLKTLATPKIRIEKYVMNTFFKPRFNYCPFIWMCCKLSFFNIKVNRLLERCLRILYNANKIKYCQILYINKYLFDIKISDFQELKCLKFSNLIYTQCFQWYRKFKISRTKNLGSFASRNNQLESLKELKKVNVKLTSAESADLVLFERGSHTLVSHFIIISL